LTEFSNNGKYLLVPTNGPGHCLLDTFTGELVHYLHRPSKSTTRPAPGDPLEASGHYLQSDAAFSPENREVKMRLTPCGSSSQGFLRINYLTITQPHQTALTPLTIILYISSPIMTYPCFWARESGQKWVFLILVIIFSGSLCLSPVYNDIVGRRINSIPPHCYPAPKVT